MVNILFIADDGFSGREVWFTDGTGANTWLLADIWPGGGPSSPYGLTPFGAGRVLFAATDPVHGTEPRLTDGTGAGTVLLRDINTDPSDYRGSGAGNFTDLGDGRAVFTAIDAARGNGLWVTDGTAEGTQPVGGLPGPVPYAGGGRFAVIEPGRAVLAAGTPETGVELWTTDGTEAGTRLLRDINPGAGGSYPGTYSQGDLIALGDGRVLFSADDGTTGRELWITDGTEEGTRLVVDLSPGGYVPYPDAPFYPSSSYPANLTLLAEGRALFTAATPDGGGTGLWVTDGTEDGTLRLTDAPSSPSAVSGAYPSGILPLGDGRALFAAESATLGRELWITDGTKGGTSVLADIWTGGGSGNPGGGSYLGSSPYGPYYPSGPYSPPYSPYVTGGQVALGDGRAMFSATDPYHGNELWITDGTAGGTRLVKDINANNQGFASSAPGQFASLGDGRAIFTATDGENGLAPWISDGTEAGTFMLRSFLDAAPGFIPGSYLVLPDDSLLPG